MRQPLRGPLARRYPRRDEGFENSADGTGIPHVVGPLQQLQSRSAAEWVDFVKPGKKRRIVVDLLPFPAEFRIAIEGDLTTQLLVLGRVFVKLPLEVTDATRNDALLKPSPGPLEFFAALLSSKFRFARDSLLEGTGFELPVPRWRAIPGLAAL
jgi:hypothetical protein